MNFYLTGDNCAELLEGTRILLREKGLQMSPRGLRIRAQRIAEEQLSVSFDGEEALIQYHSRAHFFRGLGLLLQKLCGKKFEYAEPVKFHSNGVMLDCSRNAVPKVETVFRWLRSMALLGMNILMLNMEDTYEIPSYPYFGYMRGRYSADELTRIDDYAYHLGIEVVPCIQTLAHLRTALRWPFGQEIQDTPDLLLVGDEKTYEFIRAMLEAVTTPLRSKKIHLGMDEANGLGLGQSLKKNGFQDRFSLMTQHLERVSAICGELQLEPMIWSDMFFRLHSPQGEYYDFPAGSNMESSPKPPQNVGLAYWDYYSDSPDFYKRYFDLHRQLSPKLLFAGGGWTWNGISPNFTKCIATTDAALLACKESDVRDVICTLWGDDGAETPLETGLLAMTLYGEYGFCEERPTEEQLRSQFSFCCGGDWNAFLAINAFDQTPGAAENNKTAVNPSKYLLYQDPMIGLFDQQIRELNLPVHYEVLAKRLTAFERLESPLTPLLDYYERLARLLAVKSEFGIRLKEAYDAKNYPELRSLCDRELVQCIVLSRALREARLDLWNASNKPFGGEVLDIRLAGVTARLETTRKRLEDYLNGILVSLPELEQKRLFFEPTVSENRLCSCNSWSQIISASTI